MSCCSFGGAVEFSVGDCTKQCFSINTTHGRTYCEVYHPLRKELFQPCSEVVLMIHGLGGCCKHWSESEIPPVLASRDCVVVTFDLYTHGKSEQLDNRSIKHDLDLYIQQVHDVIHHKDLPIRNSSKFVLHGFSFGGFITLNYFAKYHASSINCNTTGCCERLHTIHKIIFQSPWDGEIPLIIRGLIYVPGLLWLARPNDMKYIRSNAALKEILLNISKTKKFGDILRSVMEHLNDRINNSNIAEDGYIEMLFLSGCIEFYFTKNSKRLHRNLAFLENPNEESPRFKLRICNGADHMTFVHRSESSVGAYYRREVENFLCPIGLNSVHVETGVI